MVNIKYLGFRVQVFNINPLLKDLIMLDLTQQQCFSVEFSVIMEIFFGLSRMVVIIVVEDLK